MLADVQGGDMGTVRKIILRGIIKSLIVKDVDRSDLIWFRIGEVVICVKRVMYILFWKEFRRVFLDELKEF